MKIRVLSFLSALAICLPAAADQVRFTGQTTATEKLITDTLNTVAVLGPSRFNCPTIEAVEAQILPKSFTPPGKNNPEGSNPTTYERWGVTFCGKVVPLLIAFWPAADGGMMFRVSLHSATAPGTQ